MSIKMIKLKMNSNYDYSTKRTTRHQADSEVQIVMLVNKVLTLMIGLLVFYPLNLNAHPVIYKGGIVLNTENSENLSELHAAYSLTHRWAVGLHSIQEARRELNFVQLAHLIKRWNNVDSQANIYAILGAGAQRQFGLNESKWSSAQMIDLMADWEDRDYYIQAMQRYVHLEDNEKNWHSRLRLGLAPFRSDSHELGIWGIVQFDKMNGESWTATNLLRFYYKNVLWEVGASVNGTYQINLMLHL